MAASEASFMLLIWLNENVDFRAIGRAPKRATVGCGLEGLEGLVGVF